MKYKRNKLNADNNTGCLQVAFDYFLDDRFSFLPGKSRFPIYNIFVEILFNSRYAITLNNVF